MTSLLTPAEFKKVRWNLLGLLVMIGLGIAAVVFALQLDKKSQTGIQRAQNERSEIRNKLARAQDEEKELREKIAKHQIMASQGIIGQEHRLDWVEALRKIKQDRKLVDLQYELSPQHTIDSNIVAPDSAGFEVMTSPMKIQIQMLHEEDLLHLLSDVRQGMQAYVRTRQCSLLRLPAAAKEQGNSAMLSAECQLDWITLRQKS